MFKKEISFFTACCLIIINNCNGAFAQKYEDLKCKNINCIYKEDIDINNGKKQLLKFIVMIMKL